MLAASLSLSIALAVIFPVDSSVLNNVVTYRGSKMSDIIPATIAFEIFAVINYLFSGYTGARKEYLHLALALFVTVMGKGCYSIHPILPSAELQHWLWRACFSAGAVCTLGSDWMIRKEQHRL